LRIVALYRYVTLYVLMQGVSPAADSCAIPLRHILLMEGVSPVADSCAMSLCHILLLQGVSPVADSCVMSLCHILLLRGVSPVADSSITLYAVTSCTCTTTLGALRHFRAGSI
jgi:hypothetical protein